MEPVHVDVGGVGLEHRAEDLLAAERRDDLARAVGVEQPAARADRSHHFPERRERRTNACVTRMPLTDSASAGTYFYVVTAQDVAGNVSAPSNEATAFVTTDTTAPTVALTQPAAGAALSGTVTVAATASDNVGVAGVQFTLDGAALGTERQTAPYSIAWDTTTTSNAAHTVAAVARDAAGNRAQSSADVTVSNASPKPAGAHPSGAGEERWPSQRETRPRSPVASPAAALPG